MKKYIPILIIILGALAAYFLGFTKYISLETIKNNKNLIEEFRDSNIMLFIMLFVTTLIVIVALSIPGAIIMAIAGGFFLGQILGTFLTVIGATIGGSILFLSARLMSKDFIEKHISSRWVHRMKKGFEENTMSYLLTLRLIPIFPFVAINFACALLQIPFSTFFIGTLIGIIPGTFVFTSIGVALDEVMDKPVFLKNIIFEPKILIAFAGLGALSLLPVIYRKLKKKL